MCTLTNSTRSLTSCTTSIRSTSTQTLSSNAPEMLLSTADQELSSRDSQSPTGQKQKTLVAGKPMNTHVKHGITLCMTCILNGHHNQISLSVKIQTFSNGCAGKVMAKEILPDCSKTKFHNQPGGDTLATCSKIQMMKKKGIVFYTRSPTRTKTNQ